VFLKSALVGLNLMILLCWVVVFLAGTDVWHDLGRPDFWNPTGPPYSDLRAAAYAFYLQFFVLLTQLALLLAHAGLGRWRSASPTQSAA
jgi:hypothetical protein